MCPYDTPGYLNLASRTFAPSITRILQPFPGKEAWTRKLELHLLFVIFGQGIDRKCFACVLAPARTFHSAEVPQLHRALIHLKIP